MTGNHTIKFGEDFRHTRDFLLQTQDNGGPRGQFQFRAAQTSIPTDAAATAGFANAFASFLLDVPSLVQRDLKVTDPGRAVLGVLHLHSGQVGGHAEADARSRAAPRVLHAVHRPRRSGRALELRSGDQHAAGRRLRRRQSKASASRSYWKNFGPRAGASYRLNEKTVLRGGYGVSTLPFPDNGYVYNYPGEAEQRVQRAEQLRAGRIDEERVPRSGRSCRFPRTGSSTRARRRCATRATSTCSRTCTKARCTRSTSRSSASLPARFTLDVAYVGNRGHDVQTQFNENAATVVGPEHAGRPLFAALRQDRDVTTWIPTKTSYNSLQVKLDRRFVDGLLLTTTYTLGRGWSYVNGDSNTGIATPADIERSWARTDQDRLHTFVESFVYQLPAGPGRRWLTSGGSSARSWADGRSAASSPCSADTPINITMDAAALRAPGNTQRPDVNGTPEVLGGSRSRRRSGSTPRCSRRRPPNTFGNAPRNGVLDGPAYINLDATLAKLFSLPHGVKGRVPHRHVQRHELAALQQPERHLPWIDVRSGDEQFRGAIPAVRSESDLLNLKVTFWRSGAERKLRALYSGRSATMGSTRDALLAGT